MNHGVIVLAVLTAASASAAVVPGTSVDPAKLDLSSEQQVSLESALRQKDWRAGEAILFVAALERPESGDVLEALGELHFRAGRYLAAARAFKRADRVRPISALHRFALATAYIALERRHWARPELDRLVREDPNNASYPYWLGLIYQHYQWFDEAATELRRALKLDPRYGSAQQALGECLESAGELDEAAEAYAQALDLAGESGKPAARALWSLGSLAHDRGDLEIAEKHLRRSVKTDAELANAHYELGLVLRKRSKIKDAVASLKKAAELDPMNPDRHYALGVTLRMSGDAEGAREALRRFQELSGSARTDAAIFRWTLCLKCPSPFCLFSMSCSNFVDTLTVFFVSRRLRWGSARFQDSVGVKRDPGLRATASWAIKIGGRE